MLLGDAPRGVELEGPWEVLVLAMDDGVVQQRAIVRLDAASLAGRAEQLVELGVDSVTCEALSRPLHEALTGRGLRVHGRVVSEEEVDEGARSRAVSRASRTRSAEAGAPGRRIGVRGPLGSRGAGRGRAGSS